MSDMTPRIHDVRYNAAEQCFEALVTLHTPGGRVRVASTFSAPMTTDFEAASRGLLNTALMALGDRAALKSRELRTPIVPPRTAVASHMPHAA
ncbi:hypothetical protein [Sagittula stellata]|uniref:Uncharacterized protein n=2 Tax=Sagittula stellata TaxID=52603 RepID=A3KB30_SAGS3|nr:hypothetical protein SSE37_15988 [Sagittula stellata E-37]